MKLKAYRKLFANLNSWAFGTAVCQFVVFLLTFLLLCFAYTLIEIPDNSKPAADIFIAQFEKYLILTSAILLLIPFLFSLILALGILHKHQTLLDLWFKTSVGFAPVFTLGLLSSGIFLSVEGSYIGYVTIVISLLLGAFMTHSLSLIYCLNQENKKQSHGSDVNGVD